ncbi:S-layer homology domain-containing protein [Paenibacillus sp.]|uniref:S-layer homology domain-containing protein n=1 Tax=Paenibacillus sp. TaxID=58172 RepID=UPI002810A3AF|nr:S-layer homology domain-containing protein [Paenibacillus sp.]
MKRVSLIVVWTIVLALAIPPGWHMPTARAAEPLPPVVDGWVQVSTAAQLMYLNENQTEYVARNIRLANDIALPEGFEWKPFGGNGIPAFGGVFDGGGHRVTGVSIVDDAGDSGDDYAYVGFFGDTRGTVKNLGVSVDIFAGEYAGGLAGVQSGGLIDRSYSIGSVRGKLPAAGSASVVAGLVGSSNSAGIMRSYSTASVESGTAPNIYVAGLVGSKGAGDVDDAYARGAVTHRPGGTYAHSAGLAAFLIYGEIRDAYSTGPVATDTAGTTYPVVRGFIASVASLGAVASSYFDLDTSGTTNGGAGGAIGLSTASMKLSSSYAGWDFADTWAIHPSVNDGYPYLRHEIATESLPAATKDVPYSYTLGAFEGADTTLSWSADGLPNGLTLNEAGVLQGTPEQSGAFEVTVSAADAAGVGDERTFELIVEEFASEPASFAVEPGAAYGSTRATAVPGAAGHTFRYTLTGSAPERPFVGGAVPGEAIAYAAGSDIPAASVGQYLALYEVDGQGRVAAWGSVALEAGHIKSSFGTVTGTVYGVGDVPIHGATVSIDAASTTTDAYGRFALANVAEGGRTLLASAGGYDPANVAVAVVAGETVDIGRVSLSPTPIPAAGIRIDASDFAMTVGDPPRRLTATVEPADASDPSVVWSSDREDVAAISPSGEVSAVAPGVATIAATTADGAHTDRVVVTVLPVPPTVGSVTGAVYGANGNPLAGATVSVDGIEATTDARGSFALTNVAPGSRTVRASATGYESKDVSAVVVAGETVDVGTIALSAVRSDDDDDNDGSPASPAPASPAVETMQVKLNGTSLAIPVRRETAPDGRSALRLLADAAIVRELLAAGGIAVVEANVDDPIVKLDLPASALREARKASPDAALELRVKGASYRLPLRYWPSLPDSGTLTVAIAKAAAGVQDGVKGELAKQGYEMLALPVDFALYRDGTEMTERGEAYTVRTIALDVSPDPRASTVVWVDAKGRPHYIPSTFRPTGNGGGEAEFYAPHNSLYTVVRTERTFSDVQGHWAQGDIELLANKLIVEGAAENAFRPEDPVTRAEFVDLLVRSLGLSETTRGARFADVSSRDWYAGAAGAAVGAGLLTGYEDGTFRPDAPVTREQMAVLLDRATAFASGGAAPGATQAATPAARFKDIDDVSDWASASLARLVESEVLQGGPDALFLSQATATRAQCAAALRRMLKSLQFIDD